MKAEIGDTVWLAAQRDGKLVQGRLESTSRQRDGTWLYWVRTPFGGLNGYPAVYATLAEGEAAFAEAVEESRRRAAAMPPIVTVCPKVGLPTLDALIEAAWNHGHRVAVADEGCGDYPGEAESEEIRKLALAVLKDSGVL
jgi:hypothetical protein